jgi:hypothetical protein
MIKSVLSKSLRLVSLAALVAGGLGVQPQASPAAGFTPVDPFEQVERMGQGVNIIGYDPGRGWPLIA